MQASCTVPRCSVGAVRLHSIHYPTGKFAWHAWLGGRVPNRAGSKLSLSSRQELDGLWSLPLVPVWAHMCADTCTPPMCADTGTPPDMLVPLQQQACLFMRMVAVILWQCDAAFQALPAHYNVQADQLRRKQLAAAQVMQWLILLCA